LVTNRHQTKPEHESQVRPLIGPRQWAEQRQPIDTVMGELLLLASQHADHRLITAPKAPGLCGSVRARKRSTVHTAVKAARAKTVLYLTWARPNAPESQHAISDAYISIGRELDPIVAPVGLAWQHFLREHGTPALHDRDQSHPTLAGSYLAACVFVAVLFKTSPVDAGAGIAGLTGSDRLQLEKAAGQTVLT
jgi:hypothetical protein